MTIFVIGAIVGLAGIASGSWIIYIAVEFSPYIILRAAQRRS